MGVPFIAGRDLLAAELKERLAEEEVSWLRAPEVVGSGTMSVVDFASWERSIR
jgi:hypothetical protein